MAILLSSLKEKKQLINLSYDSQLSTNLTQGSRL